MNYKEEVRKFYDKQFKTDTEDFTYTLNATLFGNMVKVSWNEYGVRAELLYDFETVYHNIKNNKWKIIKLAEQGNNEQENH